MIWSAVTLAGLPLAWHFIRPKPPEYYGLLPDGAPVKSGPAADREVKASEGVKNAAGLAEQEFSLKQSLKTAAFWLFAAVNILQAIFWGFSVHMIPFITDRGIEPLAAGGMVAVCSLLAFPSRFLGGVIADRLGRGHLKYLLVAAYFLIALGIVIMLWLASNFSLYVFLVLWFLGNGTFVPVSIIIISSYFGRNAFGSIQGILLTISLPVAFVTPILVGRTYDTSGSYSSVFYVFAVLAVVNALINWAMRPPSLPPKVESSKVA
jgi:nitrate/nitrite transporter NarK